MVQEFGMGVGTTYSITNESTVPAKDIDSDAKVDTELHPSLSDSTDLTDLDSDAEEDDDLELCELLLPDL
jgi:hypothetical protein